MRRCGVRRARCAGPTVPPWRPGPGFTALVLAMAFLGCARGDRIVVGSKNFTEQDILGELVAQQLERGGFAVERRFHLGGTFVCHEALATGRIDVYVEYTGTALVAILREPPVAARDSALARVRAAYAARFGAEWLAPLGFDNTFAMVVRGGDARRLGLATLSDASRVPRWRVGVGYEFLERADGWNGLQRAYGLTVDAPPRVMDLGLLYRALADSQVDVVAGNATDGQIAALGLTVLADDRRYFPPYEAAPVVRRAALERHPRLRATLEALGGALDDSTMRRLNAEVDVRRRDVAEVVRAFLDARVR